MSAKTVYPAASRRGASQSTNSSSSGVALLMNTISRVLRFVFPITLCVVGMIASLLPKAALAQVRFLGLFRLFPEPSISHIYGQVRRDLPVLAESTAHSGTAEELCRDLPQQLVEFTGAHIQLQTTLASAKPDG